MFQDAPIYHQLVAERGDVPARVRDAATAIHRQLEDVMRTGRPNAAFQPGPPPPGATPRPHTELPPGQHPPR
nr:MULTISPECIES: hypothetical protein [unclassified Streptomyces]